MDRVDNLGAPPDTYFGTSCPQEIASQRQSVFLNITRFLPQSNGIGEMTNQMRPAVFLPVRVGYSISILQCSLFIVLCQFCLFSRLYLHQQQILAQDAALGAGLVKNLTRDCPVLSDSHKHYLLALVSQCMLVRCRCFLYECACSVRPALL